MKKHLITGVTPDSPAVKSGLRAGEYLLAVNGRQIEDVFDYEFFCADTEFTLTVEDASGTQRTVTVRKEESEDTGLQFENGLMDEYRSCCNRCIFCFIDQMPPGMRDTLYFKDDDSRLSFLQGNYITLTNLSEKDIHRIISYRMEPINISVHTTDPELRCRMLHNRFAGDALKTIDRFYEAGIEMNGQIVLCPDVNDKEHLDETLEKLLEYLPVMQSVSIVPVGLTRFREGLTPLRGFTSEEAAAVIDTAERWQKAAMEKAGTHFVHASDEFYLLAGRELPEEASYDGYPQLENGVGMLRLFTDTFLQELKETVWPLRRRKVTVATGLLAAPALQKLCDILKKKMPRMDIRVIPIRNRFFGESITVSGLITGQDLLEQLSGIELGSELLIPKNMLKAGENIFLDDMTLEALQKSLRVPIRPTEADGGTFLRALLGKAPRKTGVSFRPYEGGRE